MKQKKLLLILIFPLLFSIGFGSWVILSKTILAPTYNPNSKSVLFVAYNGQEAATYNGSIQGPTSQDERISDSNITFKYRKAGTKTFYIEGKPKNAGTYDILLIDKTGIYISDVVRFTISKATTASLNESISISSIYEGDALSIDNLNSLIVRGVNEEILKGEFVLKTTPIEFGSNLSNTKNVDVEFFYKITDSVQQQNYDLSSVIFSSTVTIKAVAYINNNSKTYYGNLKTALENSNNNTVYVLPNLKNNDSTLHEININETITVKQGTTLCIPYENETYTSDAAFNTLGNSVINTSEDNVKKYRRTLINFRNGANLIIASGATVQIGGIYNKLGCTNYYTEINLGMNSSITCSGELYCFGYIKENYLDARNSGQEEYLNIVDNSFDSERYLKITNGGKLITPLAIKDGTSGGVMTALANANVCAVNEFDIPLVQTYAIYEYVAFVDCTIRMSAAGNDLNKQIGFIRPNGNNDSAIFYIVSGNIALEYMTKDPRYTKTAVNEDKTKIIFNGETKMGYLNLDVQIAKINTSKYFMPFSYKFELYVNSNAILNLDYQLKMLPGSKFVILENGKLNLNSDFIVYKSSDMENLTSEEGIVYPKNLNDAELICNGTIALQSKAKIGAFIQHSNKSNTGLLDLSNINQDGLTVTSKEGTNNKEIIISSSALFNSNGTVSEKLIAANGTLLSTFDDANYFWTGNSFETFNLNVIISENSYTYPIFEYTLSMADDVNGTNETQLSATGDTAANSFKIIKGKFIKIIVNRALETKIEIGQNEENCYNNTWYQINTDSDIIISPNEGIQIIITTSGNSGAGHVVYTLYESLDGSKWTEIAKTNIGELKGYIIKNYKFKFTTESSYGYYFTTKPVYKDDKKIGIHGTENSTSSSNSALGNNIIYTADGNYEFKFSWNFCIAEGTLITMADGTYKKVEDIKAGDKVLSFNHETGKLETNTIIINDHANEPAILRNILNLKFSDGTLTRISGQQGFFDITLNKYVYITESNFNDYIGDLFYGINSASDLTTKYVTLDSCYVTEEFIKVYSPVSNRHLNIIADNMLQMPGSLSGLFNIFEYNPDTLQFNQEKMQEDIEKYGLLTYEDFKDILPYEVYILIPADYLGVSIGKGYITWDIFKEYVNKWAEDLYKLNK